MPEERGGTLDSVFHALADRTRRSMLRSLAGEHNIGELAQPHRMSFAASQNT
jgi:DNA-binding transcriptional ArsR family regulator